MSEWSSASGLPAERAEQVDRLSTLFQVHEERLYRLARRLAPTSADALDLVQDTFLKAARSPRSIPHGLANEEAWLVRVLINVRRDQWRKDAVRKRHAIEERHAPVPSDDPERVFLIRTTVWAALDHLAPRRRAVVVMHEIDGLTVASIASTLGISAITVRWHLSRGRRELARRLGLGAGEPDEQPQKPFAGRRPAPSRTSAP